MCGGALHVEVREQLVDVLFFHDVGSEDQTQGIRPGGKCLYALSHLLATSALMIRKPTLRENHLFAPADKVKHFTLSDSASILFIIHHCFFCSCGLQRSLQDIP